MPRSDRRAFLGWLAALPFLPRRWDQQPVVEVRPSALYQQPDGRKNLVRVTVSGLNAPAARARVTDRRGALVGTAGLLPAGDHPALTGEVWVPLSEPSDYQVDIEIGRDRAARRRVRLTPPRRWTLYWLASIHTAVGSTDLQENVLEAHRKNLDAALARLGAHPDFRFTADCALHVLSYLENRSPEAGDALLQAIRDGKIGWLALFANMLTGLLDHETYARLVWPAGRLARERGVTFASAAVSGVPGQPATFPTLLAASGVKYLATGAGTDSGTYPQLYYWEGPDGSRVLQWRARGYGEATRFGFALGPDEMGRRLSDWLLSEPALLARDWPYDIGLLFGADAAPNALMKDQMVANLEEFNRRYLFPRVISARAEDFFREAERRYGPRIPVRRGDTGGGVWEDGAASKAAELAEFRRAQLTARAAEILALWDGRLGDRDRAADQPAGAWRDLLLFGEHTWGAEVSVSQPASRQTVAQWSYKRRFIEAGAAAARALLDDGLLRLGRATGAGRGRLVFNAGAWERTDVARIPGGAGRAFAHEGREVPSVDLENGDALAVLRDVPPLGYLALTESDREPATQPPAAEAEALDASAGGFTVQLDPASGAIRSLTGPDGKERVKPSAWTGLNQFVYAKGNPEQREIAQARLARSRREKLPGIGARLIAERTLDNFSSIVSSVTLYDELPWVDIENHVVKTTSLAHEALYVAFPFAFTKPTVEAEVPLGRTTVDRDWYFQTHWVWLCEGTDGILWSAPDTPLFTLNDLYRGGGRRTVVPDGTLFAYAMNNYWLTNYAASQEGAATFRFRLSLLAPGDAAEPVRRGWAACDPLYVSKPYANDGPGPLIKKDRALFFADKSVMIVGAKAADDGEGAIVKLLDVSGQARAVGLWPAAYQFRLARRVNLVEQNGDAIPVGGDGRASIEVGAWGVAAARLFTPAESSG